jgi:phytoene synthase
MNGAIRLCRASIAQHSRSFSLASRLFPSSLRDDAAVVYAFCRRADDAIDLALPGAERRALGRLFSELFDVYDSEVKDDAVLSAFREVALRRQIPRRYPELLLEGMAMDVNGETYPDYDALLGYCFRVAGSVGLMMSHVMGVRDPRALRHAAHLGMAMQLTNVCRDVLEDWERGRLYLPDSLLREHGAADLRRKLGADGLRTARAPVARVIRALLSRADALYRSGDDGIPYLSFRAALATRTARLVYRDIGRVLIERGCDPFAPRAVVSTPRKLGLALSAVTTCASGLVRPFRRAELTEAIGFGDVVPL